MISTILTGKTPFPSGYTSKNPSSSLSAAKIVETPQLPSAEIGEIDRSLAKNSAGDESHSEGTQKKSALGDDSVHGTQKTVTKEAPTATSLDADPSVSLAMDLGRFIFPGASLKTKAPVHQKETTRSASIPRFEGIFPRPSMVFEGFPEVLGSSQSGAVLDVGCGVPPVGDLPASGMVPGGSSNPSAAGVLNLLKDPVPHKSGAQSSVVVLPGAVSQHTGPAPQNIDSRIPPAVNPVFALDPVGGHIGALKNPVAISVDNLVGAQISSGGVIGPQNISAGLQPLGNLTVTPGMLAKFPEAVWKQAAAIAVEILKHGSSSEATLVHGSDGQSQSAAPVPMVAPVLLRMRSKVLGLSRWVSRRLTRLIIPTAVFSKEDAELVSAVFKFALIGKYSYGKPDTIEIRKHLQNSGFGICKVQILNFKHVLITLPNEAFYAKLWLKREFNVLGSPMRLFKWDPDFNFKHEPATAPVWVKIFDLPIQWYDARSLHTVGSLIGSFIKPDLNTVNRSRLHYARICVEIDLKKTLHPSVGIKFNGVTTELKVEYEKIPSYCNHCHHMGHDIDACYFKNPDLRPKNFANKFQKTSVEKGKEIVDNSEIEWTVVSKNNGASTSRVLTQYEKRVVEKAQNEDISVTVNSKATNGLELVAPSGTATEVVAAVAAGSGGAGFSSNKFSLLETIEDLDALLGKSPGHSGAVRLMMEKAGSKEKLSAKHTAGKKTPPVKGSPLSGHQPVMDAISYKSFFNNPNVGISLDPSQLPLIQNPSSDDGSEQGECNGDQEVDGTELSFNSKDTCGDKSDGDEPSQYVLALDVFDVSAVPTSKYATRAKKDKIVPSKPSVSMRKTLVGNLNNHIWVFSDNNTTINVLKNTNQLLHTSISHNSSPEPYELSVVYAKNTKIERRELWEDLVSVSQFHSPWMVGGDFNIVLHPVEKKGDSPPIPSEMEEFRDAILDCDLTDGGFVGPPFTWHSNGVWQRLDRIFFFASWFSKFTHCCVRHLPRQKSDHHALLCEFHKDASKHTSSFRFQNMWAKHHLFLDVVSDSWSIPMPFAGLLKLSKKLSRLKLTLKEWNRHVFGNIFEKVAEANDKAADAEAIFDTDPT
ncbi:hypothetical protein OROMI_021139 [Orobanche minor]